MENNMPAVRCPCDCRKLPEFTTEEVGRVIAYLGDDIFDTRNVFEIRKEELYQKRTSEGIENARLLREGKITEKEFYQRQNVNDDEAQAHYISQFQEQSSDVLSRLTRGMNEELEHCDVTGGDPVLTAKIALAHLREDPDYYAKLKKAGL